MSRAIRKLSLDKAVIILLTLFLAACAAPPPPDMSVADVATPTYKIGPLDNIQVFVWRNPELSITVPVRPDGRISTPLIQDLQAAGKTPSELAEDIEEELQAYVQEPIVTVIVSGFSGPLSQQIRVVGEAANPVSIPYRSNMTALDAMIAVGGLTQFAAGNRTRLVRGRGEEQQVFNVRLDDLLKNGDISANVEMQPGDILIIPESYF